MVEAESAPSPKIFVRQKAIFEEIVKEFVPKFKFASLKNPCEEKFSKKILKGGHGGSEIFINFLFKSCSESSETNFGIIKVEIFNRGSIWGSNFDPKGSIFFKSKILTPYFIQFKLIAIVIVIL